MRTIDVAQVQGAVAELCQSANFELAEEMRTALRAATERETAPLAKNTLFRILANADLAAQRRMPMCQDTGLIIIFAEIGQDVHLTGGSLRDAINDGIREGYRKGYLRPSVTGDPLERKNTGDNTPAILYTELVPGSNLRLRLLAKGGGCENMSRFKMLTPSEGREGTARFIVDTAKLAGPNACPPMIVGVGIGGSFDYSAVLAKKSLLRSIGEPNPIAHVADLEREVLAEINRSGIGPQGYGGKTTSLAVHVEVAACHIASLPVSVNIECHAHRHQEVTL